MIKKYGFLFAVIIINAIPGISYSAVYQFDFTGRLTVTGPTGIVVSDKNSAGVYDPYGAQTHIESTLTYDDTTKSGTLGLTIAPFSFLTDGNTVIHSISFESLTDNLLVGNMLVDWSTWTDIELTTVWDASGLFNAVENIIGGLQVGDVISGNTLLRNGIVIDSDIGSATPATDGINTVLVAAMNGNSAYYTSYNINQGPAPLAMTTWNYDNGVLSDDGIAGSPLTGGPYPGFNINLDIGSGNSLTLTSINAAVVPIPAAIWLFASGLLCLARFYHQHS